MSDEDGHGQLSERLDQDVWHDKFVVDYSPLASAQPSRLVLIGVWMFFGPAVLSALVMGLSAVQDPTDVLIAVVSSLGSLFCFGLAVAILIKHTRRYLHASRDSEVDPDE